MATQDLSPVCGRHADRVPATGAEHSSGRVAVRGQGGAFRDLPGLCPPLLWRPALEALVDVPAVLGIRGRNRAGAVEPAVSGRRLARFPRWDGWSRCGDVSGALAGEKEGESAYVVDSCGDIRDP